MTLFPQDIADNLEQEVVADVAEVSDKKESWHERVAALNLTSYTSQDEDWSEDNCLRYLEKIYQMRQQPSEWAKRVAAGKVYKPGMNMMKLPIIDDLTTIKNLELIVGAHAPKNHLLSFVDRTSTTVGRCALMQLLASPSADKKTLLERQEAIKFLFPKRV